MGRGLYEFIASAHFKLSLLLSISAPFPLFFPPSLSLSPPRHVLESSHHLGTREFEYALNGSRVFSE